MDTLFTVLTILLPVALALSIGYFTGKKQIISRDQTAGMKRFVSDIALPAVLFGAFYNAEYTSTLWICAFVVFVACIVGLFAGKLTVKCLKLHKPLIPYLTTGFEMGMMGYALYMMTFGKDQVSNMAIADLGQVVFVFSVYKALLSMRKGLPPLKCVRDMFTSPVMISILAGLLLGATGLGKLLSASRAGSVIDACVDFIGGPTSCIILFVVGSEMVISRERLKDALIAAALRAGIMAFLLCGTLFTLKLFCEVSAGLSWAIILMFSLPGPFVLPMFVTDQEESAYVATCLSVYTLLSLAFFVVITLLAV